MEIQKIKNSHVDNKIGKSHEKICEIVQKFSGNSRYSIPRAEKVLFEQCDKLVQIGGKFFIHRHIVILSWCRIINKKEVPLS